MKHTAPRPPLGRPSTLTRSAAPGPQTPRSVFPTTRVHDYTDLALRGLPASFLIDSLEFSQTVRQSDAHRTGAVRREGTSLRYTAIVALGLGSVPLETQKVVLYGYTARDLVSAAAKRAQASTDPGAIALTAWASAEVSGAPHPALFAHLADLVAAGEPLPTVDASWMLTAAVAALHVNGETRHAADIAQAVRDRLLTEQGPQGIFPHALPASSLNRFRSHVGCFADQVYPIQALARLAAATADAEALAAANRSAARICELQGDAGQWWWHYDARDGTVVEPYPVYSVHQHAMAPMALLDLAHAGGDRHSEAILRGLEWLSTHPEVPDSLISDDHSLIWRKVGRHEPAKLARRLNALTTSIRPGWHLHWIDSAFPATVIDHECRPYELGWLVYAWRTADQAHPFTTVEGDRP